MDAETAPEDSKAEEPPVEEAKAEPVKPCRPAAAAAGLVPGHAADDVAGGLLGARDGRLLRGLGYRVHPPTRRNRAAAWLSRSSRALCANARSSASASASKNVSVASSAAASARSDRTNGNSSLTRRVAMGPLVMERLAMAPTAMGRPRDGANRGPRPEGQRVRMARGPTARDGPRKDGPLRDDRRGPRPPRRDTGGPALRLAIRN